MIDTTHISPLRHNRHHGFTMVELLVTITIIVVLAALSFSVAGKIRASAQQTTLLSAIRQIGVANVAYASENSGSINVIRDDGEKGTYEGGGGGDAWFTNTFVGRMQPFLFAGLEPSSGKPFQAAIVSSFAALYKTTNFKTMSGTPFAGKSPYGDTSGIPNPIAVNQNMRPIWGAKNPPRKVSSIDDPSRTLYLSYGRYYFTDKDTEKYKALSEMGKSDRGIYYLPNRQGIFCFVDGHTEILSPPISKEMFGTPPPKIP